MADICMALKSNLNKLNQKITRRLGRVLVDKTAGAENSGTCCLPERWAVTLFYHPHY
jgi:hypothetical protein